MKYQLIRSARRKTIALQVKNAEVIIRAPEFVKTSYIDDLVALNERSELKFEWLFVDGTVLKTIIRANPGIITMDKATVTGKWNWIDADNFKP